MTKLLAFHGEKAIQQKYIDRIREHRKAEKLIQGNSATCAIGCTLNGRYDHKAYEDELGIPEVLARLEDAIFEGLDKEDAMQWPEKFLSAINPGADLSMVWPKFALAILTDEKIGCMQYAGDKHGVKEAIEGVAQLYREWISTGNPPSENAENAAGAARAAESAYIAAWQEVRGKAGGAWSAARAAWGAARAANVVWEANISALCAAWSATESAARAASAARNAANAAWNADRNAALKMYWKSASEKLLELLKEAR